MRFLLLLVCVAFTGCHANLARRDPPQPQVDMVKDAFWDYVAKATRTAEDSLRQIRESELGRDVNSLISQSTVAVNKLTDALQTKVAPATSDLLSGLSQEAERLRARVEQQLAAVEKEATPLATELAASLQRQAEQLRKEATPLAAALQQNLAPYGEELKEQLDALWDAFTQMVQ